MSGNVFRSWLEELKRLMPVTCPRWLGHFVTHKIGAERAAPGAVDQRRTICRKKAHARRAMSLARAARIALPATA